MQSNVQLIWHEIPVLSRRCFLVGTWRASSKFRKTKKLAGQCDVSNHHSLTWDPIHIFYLQAQQQVPNSLIERTWTGDWHLPHVESQTSCLVSGREYMASSNELIKHAKVAFYLIRALGTIATLHSRKQTTPQFLPSNAIYVKKGILIQIVKSSPS